MHMLQGGTSKTCTHSPPPPTSTAAAATAAGSSPGPELAGEETERREKKEEGRGKKRGVPQNEAEKGTGNVGEAMLISGHHAACSQALRRGRKWQKSVSQYNVNVHRIGT